MKAQAISIERETVSTPDCKALFTDLASGVDGICEVLPGAPYHC